MTRVLAAERDMLAAIACCQQQADKTLGEARAAVRKLVRHTNDRISRLHADCAARTRELVTALEREAAERAASTGPGRPDDDRLLDAVRAVARRLTEPDVDRVD